jgi:hypothetical protein
MRKNTTRVFNTNDFCSLKLFHLNLNLIVKTFDFFKNASHKATEKKHAFVVCYDNVKILNSSWESCNGNNRWGGQWELNATQGICYAQGMLDKKEGVRAYLDPEKAKKYFPRTLPSQEYFE